MTTRRHRTTFADVVRAYKWWRTRKTSAFATDTLITTVSDYIHERSFRKR